MSDKKEFYADDIMNEPESAPPALKQDDDDEFRPATTAAAPADHVESTVNHTSQPMLEPEQQQPPITTTTTTGFPSPPHHHSTDDVDIIMQTPVPVTASELADEEDNVVVVVPTEPQEPHEEPTKVNPLAHPTNNNDDDNDDDLVAAAALQSELEQVSNVPEMLITPVPSKDDIEAGDRQDVDDLIPPSPVPAEKEISKNREVVVTAVDVDDMIITTDIGLSATPLPSFEEDDDDKEGATNVAEPPPPTTTATIQQATIVTTTPAAAAADHDQQQQSLRQEIQVAQVKLQQQLQVLKQLQRHQDQLLQQQRYVQEQLNQIKEDDPLSGQGQQLQQQQALLQQLQQRCQQQQVLVQQEVQLQSNAIIEAKQELEQWASEAPGSNSFGPPGQGRPGDDDDKPNADGVLAMMPAALTGSSSLGLSSSFEEEDDTDEATNNDNVFTATAAAATATATAAAAFATATSEDVVEGEEHLVIQEAESSEEPSSANDDDDSSSSVGSSPPVLKDSNTEEATFSVSGTSSASYDDEDINNNNPLKPSNSKDTIGDDHHNKTMEPSTPLTEAPTMFFTDSDQESSFENHDDYHGHDDSTCHIRSIRKIHSLVIRLLQLIAGVAVQFPKITLLALSALSIGLVAAGLFTNFHIETDTHDLWPPSSSLSLDHAYWLIEDSYFGYDPVQLDVIIHKHGENVLGQSGVDRVFEVQTIFTAQRGYKEGCAWAELFGDLYWVGQCSIDSVSDFWNESYAMYYETVESDEDAIEYLSSTIYPTGVMVDVDTIMGKTTRDADSGLLTHAESYLIKFNIPWSNVTLDFEQDALARMLLLRDEWEGRGDEFTLEVRSYSSYGDEFLRAIQEDLWLLPLAFLIVALFTVFCAFGKCDRVESRGLLGIGAVVTIVGSLMSSFGIMFLIGIPFTTQTVMVPFLMFGIGLDDAFIIYGSYNRKSHIKDIKQRVQSTMQDVGVSVFLTSLTSMLAFVLGSFSQIPAVRWLCLYAFPCIGIDFFYQITFFVALIVLDERRIQQGRMDYCTCITIAGRRQEMATTHDEEEIGDNGPMMDAELPTTPTTSSTPPQVVAEPFEEHVPPEQQHVADRLMGWWAMQLISNQQVQLAALVAFVALSAGSVYCATQLEQEFDFVDLVPADSYVKSYYTALDTYTTRDGENSFAYFTGLDQGRPEVQEAMEQYIEDLITKANVDEPVYFWLWDFRQFLEDAPTNSSLHDLPFHWQVREFLKEDIYYELYDEDIGRSHRGIVMESRVAIHINVDIQDTQETTEMLATLREVSASQPVNQDAESPDDWHFFTYTGQYHLYEFYNQVVEELIFTTIMGVLAINVIAMLFIPHWTAVLFVLPFISLLYINMLGFLYLSGVQINAISYVTLVMSIGLMVDYIMHILMRYYDSKGTRQQRVHETLTTMGSSIFLGAASTFLGILCLSMSTSDILQDIFVSCVGLITFGVLNGLIFLPVTLAMIGPE